MTGRRRAGLGSVPLFTTYDLNGNLPSPLNTANTPPTQIPWPVLPGRGRRGILKSMTAENEGAFKKQSSTSWPVVNTSTQVESSENVHSMAEATLSWGGTAPSQAALENTLLKD